MKSPIDSVFFCIFTVFASCVLFAIATTVIGEASSLLVVSIATLLAFGIFAEGVFVGSKTCYEDYSLVAPVQPSQAISMVLEAHDGVCCICGEKTNNRCPDCGAAEHSECVKYNYHKCGRYGCDYRGI